LYYTPKNYQLQDLRTNFFTNRTEVSCGGGQRCYNWDYNIIIKEFKEKPKNNKQKVKKLLLYLGSTLKK
jgi:hypothetical protein